MLIAVLSLASCSFRGCTALCKHEWDGGVLINATECGEGAIARITCLNCGKTLEVSARNHNYILKTNVEPSCTSMGYTEYDCSRCDATCVSGFVNAIGHSYGEEMAVKEESCTSSGSYVRICEKCGDAHAYSHSAKGHSYQLLSDDDTGMTYQCKNCSDILAIEKEEEIEEFIGSEELFDVDPAFSFNIVSSESESSIREKLRIFEQYFDGTEFESEQDVIKEYKLTRKGNNVWTVSVISNYEYDTTYIAKLDEGVTFAEYKCTELVFTVIEDPNHENTYDFKDEIVFLQALENANPGYYPYYISSTEESEYLYLAVNKIDELEKGQILCVGDVTSTDQIDEETECYFGKIDDYYQLPDGTWMVVLSEPDLSEIFSELDIVFNDDIDFDNEDINIEELEAGIIAQLYDSEDFIQFLSTINVSASKYFEANDYNAVELSNIKSFLDKLKIEPDIDVDGTTIIATLNGKLELPIEDKNKNKLGDFKLSFTVKTENQFGLDMSYKIKWKWFKPSIKHFDLAVIQSTKFDFNFDVSIDVDYSLEENKYVQNIESKKIHRSTCPHITRMTDLSKLKGLTVVATEKMLKDNPEWGCKHCQPTIGFKYDLLVINKSQETIHAYDCMHVAQMSENNKILSEEKASYWVKQGYTCCDWCHPDNREEKEFAALYTETLYCSDWQQVATDIVQLIKDSGASEYAQKGVTLVHIDIPICYLVKAGVDLNFVFSFKLEASLKYEYSYQQENRYGMRLTNGGVHAYTNKESKVLENSLTMMGKAEIRAGLFIDANISVKGLSKWIRAGLSAEVGMYAKLSGILSLSTTKNENYAAAYFEVGVYVDVQAYYKLVKLNDDFEIYADEWPLFALGYANAYFAYETYYDELEIDSSYDIAEENLLSVKYFDLKTMEAKKDELSLSELEKYKVNIEFADGRYCRIENGKIVATSDAPCYFTDKITITVDCDDSWKDFKPDGSVYYLGTYEIEIEFHSNNEHTYDNDVDEICNLCGFERTIACYHTETTVLEAKAPTCTEKGLTEGKKCLGCDEVLIDQEDIPALGHTEVIDEGYKATCTSTGLTEGKHCSVCNTVLVEQAVIEMLKHVYSAVTTNPTCTERGYTTYTCECGDNYVGNYVDAYGHSFGEWETVKEPTTTQEGLKERRCECGETQTQTIDKLTEEKKYSEGLKFKLKDLGESCSVVGIGTCTDTDIVIPDTYEGLPVTSIGSQAFSECDSLTSVVIPDSVTSIGYEAFNYCTSLTSVVIPDSVTSIGDHAFQSCDSLTSIEIGDSVTSIGDRAFYDCNSLTSVVIPDSLTSIGNYAFYNCYSLTSVVIPDSVTSIGDGAFSDCDSLTNVVIPDSVKSIGDAAFDGCDSLTSVVIPDSVTSIGDDAFSWCYSLTSVVIPDSVTSIGNDAFLGCDSLTSIVIPDSVTSIGEGAFESCTSLTSVVIPDSVTSIGDDAFSYCFSLTSIEVDEKNERYCSIDGNLYNKDATTLIQYAIGKTDTSFTIPDSVTSIGNSAFSWCSSLTSINIPDSVTSIGDYAFYNCSKLTSIVIPDSVTSIGNRAFYYCRSLTSVVIPDSVTSIGDHAFYSCNSLTIYCEAEAQPAGWNSKWNPDNRPVVWGYKGE